MEGQRRATRDASLGGAPAGGTQEGNAPVNGGGQAGDARAQDAVRREGWRVVIAPDSFKGSLTALEAAEAMEEGVRQALPQAQTLLLPVADGGEGTVDAVLRACGGRKIPVRVTGPLGTPVDA
ncbi:MAG: glycerate kinase, partial [Firmicutes bacterium]|nr:glycerate kinase [Bacillota bacterium]